MSRDAEVAVERDFTPALGNARFTPFYDLAIRLLTREHVWRDTLIQQINVSASDRILDVGCGTGSLAIRLKGIEPAAEVIGLDPDAEVLARAQRKARKTGINIEWWHGFLTDEMVAQIGPVSKVVSSLVFHQTSLDEKANLLSAMHSVLAPLGTLHIADYGLQKTKLMRVMFRRTVQMIDGIEDTQPNADGVLPDLIKAAGFTDLHETRVIATATGSISVYGANKDAC